MPTSLGFKSQLLIAGFFVSAILFSHPVFSQSSPSAKYIREVDELSALWSSYKHTYLQNGRVSAVDEKGITTSEGQSYGMLRAVWLGDRLTFDRIWEWTRTNLQVRGDKLFAWKWKDRVLDKNSASDADCDIALALILGSRRFQVSHYLKEALEILEDIWTKAVLNVDDRYYLTAGNWALAEAAPPIHVGYLAPYAYELFASADHRRPWLKLVESTYGILHWIYSEKKFRFPPQVIAVDRANGNFQIPPDQVNGWHDFGYDAVPIFWRVAVDAVWFSRGENALRLKMLDAFKDQFRLHGKIFDSYTLDGRALGENEGLALYASVYSLARVMDGDFANQLWHAKAGPLWNQALEGKEKRYYFQNWMWFSRALELKVIRKFDEFLGFLRPFDFNSFTLHFPWVLSALTLILFFLARLHIAFRISFLGLGIFLCARYFYWRAMYSLNFIEPSGPVISLLLLGAEFYCFSTVLLLILQVGFKPQSKPERPSVPTDFAPTVDIFIPIYSESLEILEKTLIAANAIRYANKKIHVCDDSRREAVRELSETLGANYILGPKKHAKAGNLNNAMGVTSGELILVFDTDHIPVVTFLEETILYFADPRMGFVQTPHHFYNEDIFQKAFRSGRLIPNEQDMFSHAIQNGRNSWGGAFFVGSGAIFRREAIAQLGGFKLMSITEDIHTSQHLHARGWKSAFVDKDLAVGLTAENFSGHVVQRRRWMLGCLQIFFKDNPLFCKGLSLRHRIGYFASLYYFFFPLSRLVFWMTPLFYLLFHWHPIFSEVSVLVAYLVPYMIALPLISAVLLPGWPRAFWGILYETTLSFTLARSMFDLLLPKSLGFKVTPKGVTSERRAFDFDSSKALLIATGISIFAIAKGIMEFVVFGIEKDAYFFNLAWATVNLAFLLAGLLIAWERPQRRREDRIRKRTKFELIEGSRTFTGFTEEISLSGFSFATSRGERVPKAAEVRFQDTHGVISRVEFVHQTSRGVGRALNGYRFIGLDARAKRGLLLDVFSSPATWERAHDSHTRSNFLVALLFFTGIVRGFLPFRGSHSKDVHD